MLSNSVSLEEEAAALKASAYMFICHSLSQLEWFTLLGTQPVISNCLPLFMDLISVSKQTKDTREGLRGSLVCCAGEHPEY